MDSLTDQPKPPQYVAAPADEEQSPQGDIFQSGDENKVSILPDPVPDGVQGTTVTVTPDLPPPPDPVANANAQSWNDAKPPQGSPQDVGGGGSASGSGMGLGGASGEDVLGDIFADHNLPSQKTSSTPNDSSKKSEDILGDIFAENHTDRPTSGTMANHGEAKSKIDSRPSPFASELLPRDVKLAAVRDGGNASVSTLRDAVLDGSYNMKKMAEKDGYQFLITSGTDGTHSQHSFHYQGEAIDFRILGKNGKELPRDQESQLGAKYADAAGFGSMIDELHFTPNGDIKPQGVNPHMHAAWGNEQSAKNATLQFHSRDRSDPDYYKTYAPDKATMVQRDQPLTRMAQLMAIQVGVDPDVFGRLISQESAWNPNATSKQGAIGLTQLMPGTAADLAKADGHTVDEIRKDPKLQLYYGAKYLKQQIDDPASGGSYARALVAYNAGPGNRDAFLKGTPMFGETKDYITKILGSLDSSGIKTQDDAVKAFMAGTGYMHQADHIANQRQALVNDVVAPMNTLLSRALGTNSISDFVANVGTQMASDSNPVMSPNSRFQQMGSWMGSDTFMGRLLSSSGMTNPLGEDANMTTMGQVGNAALGTALQAGSAMFEMANQFAHHLTFGLTPESNVVKELGESTSGFGKVASYGLFQAGAMVPAMEMTMGWMAGKVARTMGILPESVGLLAENSSTMSLGRNYMLKAASGGYGAASFPTLAAAGTLGAQGFVQASIEHFMDYAYNPTEESKNMTQAEKVQHSMGAGMMGALFNLTLGAVLPAAATVGESWLRGITVGEMNTAKALSNSSLLQRTGAGLLKGAGTGGAVAAVGNMFGIDEAIAGHPVSGQDAVLNGVAVGSGIGMLAYGGLPFGTRALNAASKSIPALGSAMDAARSAFSRLDPSKLPIIGAFLTKAGADLARKGFESSVKTVTEDMTTAAQSHMSNMGQVQDALTKNIQDVSQKFQQSQQMVDGLTKKVQAAPTAIPDFQTRMSEYTDLQNSLKTTKEQKDLLQQQNPKDPQTQATELRYQSAQKKLSDFEKTVDEDSGLNWNRKVADIYQTQADLATQAPVMQQQELKLKAQQTKLSQLTSAMTWNKQQLQNHIAGYDKMRALNLDTSQTPLFLKSNDSLLALHRELMDTTHHSNTDFLNHLSNSYEAGIQTVSGLDGKVEAGMSKDAALAFAKRMDDSFREEAMTMFRSTRDPDSVVGSIINRNIKSVAPWVSEITPQFDPNYHKMEADRVAYNQKFKDVYQPIRKGTSVDKINQDVNNGGNSQKLKYDYESASNQSLAQVRPSLVQDYVKQVAEKYTGDSTSFTPGKVNPKYLMDNLGDIQSKGLPIQDLDSITRQLSKDPTNSNAMSSLHSLYDQSVVAENAGDTHMPMGSSKDHLDFIRRDVFKANQKTLTDALKEKARGWNELASKMAPEVVEGMKGSAGSNDYTRGAYTDLAYNPEYVLRSAYHTADSDALLRSQFKMEPGSKLLKFDNKAVQDNLQGELNRLNEFNKLVVGKQNVKTISPETMQSVGVDRNSGNNAKHLVLDSTRQNLVEKIGDAANSNDKVNKTFDDLLFPKTGVGFFLDDKINLRSYENTMMSEVLNPGGNMSIEKVRGWVSSTLQSHIYNRLNAGRNIANRLKEGYQSIISSALDTINSDRKIGKVEQVHVDDFQKDIRNVLEGSDSLAAIRDKYKRPDGSSDHLDAVVGYSNRLKAVTETMKAANPQLSDFMRPLYVHSIFPDASAKMAAHGSGGNVGGLLGSENRKNITSLKQLEGWVRESKEEIKSKMGIAGRAEDWTNESFESLPLAERVSVLKNMSEDNFKQLKVSDPVKYKSIQDDVNSTTLAYLYEKPLSDLPHIMTAEFRSALHADSWRRTLTFLKNSPVDLSGDGSSAPRKLLEIKDSGDTTDTSFKGPKGERLIYQAFSELPGNSDFHTQVDGEDISGKNMMLHPEAFNFFKENLNPSPPTLLGPLAKSPLSQALTRLHNLSRGMNLLGTWIPHLSQVMGSIQAGFMMTPLEAASIVPLGRRIMEESSTNSEQLKLHAIRSGVNSRALDQGTRFLANEVATVLGSDMSSKLWGVADPRMGNRFLQSLDSRDPAQKDAYNLLPEWQKNASNFLGGGAEYNHLQLQNSLYTSIEAGMFGSFYHEIATMQKAMGGTLGEMEPTVATQFLEKTCAQLTNERAGALPYFGTPTAFRRELGELALAPGWVMSKANMIIDAFDGILGLGQKTLGKLVGKSVDASELVSLGDLCAKAGFQKRYEGYPPEAKMYLRERMAQGVGSLLVAGAGMSIAFNMMKNGAPPWVTNPPDKMFHLKVGDTYWSNPLMVGSVRDILRFVGDSQQTDKDVIAKIGDAISGIVDRNLSPDVAALEQWGRGKDEDGKPITVDARQGPVASIPQRLADYGSYVFRKSANWEGMTGTKDNPQLADLLRQNPDYLVKTQTSPEYLARSVGSYDSYYNISQHVSKDAKDRLDQYRYMATDRIEGIAKAARVAQQGGQPEQAQKLLRMIPQVVQNGVEFRDDELKKAYATQGGKFHLAPEEVMNIVQRVMNPSQYALRKETSKTASGAIAGQKIVDQQRGEQQSQDWWKK